MTEKKKIRTKKTKNKRIAGPRVSHTKGYYRFSKEFPSVTDSNGFRDNNTFVNSRSNKVLLRSRLSVLFIFVFVLSFCITALCTAISKVPVAEDEKEVVTVTDNAVSKALNRMITFSGDVLVSSSIENIISECKTSGATAVIIELKDAQGHFYFKPSISIPAEALATVIADISSIIKEIKQQGIGVYASVSCFSDDIYARNNQSLTAYITSVDDSGNESKSIWYGGENGTNAWLSPFSNEVCYYLTTIIGDVAALGVDGIIFENTTVPINTEKENVKFAFSSEYESSVQDKIANWLSYTVSTIDCKAAVTLSSQQLIADSNIESIPAYYNSGCDFVILDSRPSDAEKGVAINGLQYLEPERTPKEYVSALLGLSFEFFKTKEINMQLIPVIDNNTLSELQLSAVEEFDVDTIVFK